MKTRYLWMMALLLLWGARVQATDLELRGAANIYYPTGSIWKTPAVGGEVKIVQWYSNGALGIGMSMGYERWEVSDDPVNQASNRIDVLSGSANYLPLGLSVLARGDLAGHPSFRTTVDAGIYYMKCRESLQLTRSLDTGGGSPLVQTSSVSCEDSVVGRLAVGLELLIGKGRSPAALFLNLGYQVDLDKGRVSGDRWTHFSQDVRLEAGFIQLGVSIPLN